MSKISLGYRQPDPETIKLEEYDIFIDGKELFEYGDGNSNAWAYETPVSAIFHINADLNAAFTSCGLSTNQYFDKYRPAVLGLCIAWKSTKTGLHGVTEGQPLVNGLQSISVELPPGLTGGTVTFTVLVYLLQAADLEVPLSPTIPGSKLWESTVSVVLEGAGSQFPTSAFDFRKNGIEPPKAMWLLEIDPRLDLHISAAVRLKLNTGHKRIKAYLDEPEAPNNEDFRNFLEADVLMQMMLRLFTFYPEDVLEASQEVGTLADALVGLHTIIFNEQPIEESIDRYKSEPEYIFAKIQSYQFAKKKLAK